MNRRKILTWVGLGWLVSVLPSTLTSCSTATKQAESTALANPIPAASPVAETSTIASSPVAATTVSKGSRVIGSIAQLERDGQLIADGVIVVRDRRNQKLFAVNPICTHKGCDVNWQQDKQEFFCPCHDATFTADGSPREAPAKIPLATYAVTVEDEQVLLVGDTSSSSNLQNNQASTNESPSKRDRQSSEGKSDVQTDDDSPKLSPKKQERRSSESESEQEDEECRKQERKQSRT